MGLLNLQSSHDGGDVVARLLPSIGRGFGRHVRGRIAASVVGDAVIGTREETHLRLPFAVVGAVFMDEDDRMAGARLLDEELYAARLDEAHGIFPSDERSYGVE